MIKRLEELKIGDKFWFADKPYLVIDIDLNNMTFYTDFSSLVPVLDLATYKILCFSKTTKIIQDKDNFPV
jgi:hypothetical protein